MRRNLQAGHRRSGGLHLEVFTPDELTDIHMATLDVLEELGLIRHGHGPDGREEFHVLPETEHGHLHCEACGGRWEIGVAEAASLVDGLRARHGFQVDLSHLTVVGRCRSCTPAG